MSGTGSTTPGIDVRVLPDRHGDGAGGGGRYRRLPARAAGAAGSRADGLRGGAQPERRADRARGRAGHRLGAGRRVPYGRVSRPAARPRRSASAAGCDGGALRPPAFRQRASASSRSPTLQGPLRTTRRCSRGRAHRRRGARHRRQRPPRIQRSAGSRFRRPRRRKIVELDDVCRPPAGRRRRFPTEADVPAQRRDPHHSAPAATPDRLFCVAPGAQQEAGRHAALRDPIGRACPATALRTAPRLHALSRRESSVPMASDPIDADALCDGYFDTVTALMRAHPRRGARARSARAASALADQIAADRLVHVYGPGGHSNLASQEIFFRAGGLMHIAAILDEGTLLSNGALRSMAIERTPGYGRIVIADRRLGADDLLILVNAYGINAALIDAALEAQAAGRCAHRRQLARARGADPAGPSRRGTRRSRTCTMWSTSPSTPRCRSATPVVSVPGFAEPDRGGLDLRQCLRAQLPRHPHGGAARRTRDRSAGLAQRQRARRRRGQRPLHRPLPRTASARCDAASAAATPATGGPLAVEVEGGRISGRRARRSRRDALAVAGTGRPAAQRLRRHRSQCRERVDRRPRTIWSAWPAPWQRPVSRPSRRR